tara:strand:+ start:20646 stop:21197 length:552 start_codon:yes stop_codon:yes gene_type:complete
MGINLMKNKKSMMKRIKQRGFTAIELIIALGVIAVLGGALLKFGGGLMSSGKAKVNSDFIGMLVSTTRPLKSPGVGYANLTSTVVAGYIDEGFVSGGTIINSYGSALVITPVSFAGVSNNALSIADGLYPSQDCNKTISSIGDSMLSVTVNGTSVKASGSPLNKATLQTACSSTSNSVVWTYN